MSPFLRDKIEAMLTSYPPARVLRLLGDTGEKVSYEAVDNIRRKLVKSRVISPGFTYRVALAKTEPLPSDPLEDQDKRTGSQRLAEATLRMYERKAARERCSVEEAMARTLYAPEAVAAWKVAA